MPATHPRPRWWPSARRRRRVRSSSLHSRGLWGSAEPRSSRFSTETAAAALALYREHRGDRPVTGVIYSHSHVDHFGGARGVVSEEDVASGHVPALAPQGFPEHAISENVYAGGAMTRHATYMYGALLPKAPPARLGRAWGRPLRPGRSR